MKEQDYINISEKRIISNMILLLNDICIANSEVATSDDLKEIGE
jgi:hypothetical protein